MMLQLSANLYTGFTAFFILVLLFIPQLALCDQAPFSITSSLSSELEHDIIEAARTAALMKSCRSCQALLFSMKRLASLGDDAFISTLVNTCKNRKVNVP